MRSYIFLLRNWLWGLVGIGLLTAGVGVAIFLGWFYMDQKVYFYFPYHSFFGLEYQAYLGFSAYILLVCWFLLLSILPEKHHLRGLNTLSLFLTVIGIEVLGYGLLRNSVPTLPVLLSWHESGDYIVWGLFLLIIGIPPMVFRSERSKGQLLLSRFFVTLGFVLLALSWIEYSALFYPSIPRSLWWIHFVLGCLFLLSGGLPLTISYMSTHSSFFDSFYRIFLGIACIGGIIYATPTLVHNGFLPLSLLHTYHYFELLLIGALLLSMGLIPVGTSHARFDTHYRYRYIFLAVFLGGVLQLVVAVTIASLTGLVEGAIDPRVFDPTILAMTWDVWWVNGATFTLIGLIFLNPLLFYETQGSEARGARAPTEITKKEDVQDVLPKVKKKGRRKKGPKPKVRQKRQRIPGS